MQIGNFDTSSLTGGLAGKFAGALTAVFWGILIFIVVGVTAWIMYAKYKNKTFYVTPVTLSYFYSNGTQKDRHELVGGKFLNSKGVWDFRVKIPKQMKKKELGYMPDMTKADSDGRVCFMTYGDGTLWQQYEKKLITKTVRRNEQGDVIQEIDLLIKPIPTDIKTVTVNSIKNWRETVDKSKVTTFAIAIGGFIIMVCSPHKLVYPNKD